jgi:hypothetical protein
MSAVFTLQQVMDKQGLGPDARAFCEALLKHGEVLAVTLSYLPETILWLVTTPSQARIMRDTQPKAVVITLGEAADMATSVGAARPTSLWQVAVGFSAPPPPSLEDGAEEADDPDDHPWNDHDPWD